MEEFLNKYVYLNINIDGRTLHFVCAFVKSISDTHITIIDKTKNDSLISFRKMDVVEIKLSNRIDKDGNLKNE